MASKSKTIEVQAERDYWPNVPTREDCVDAGFPTDFQSTHTLTRLWPALTIEEKATLGFTQTLRAGQIERLIEDLKGKKP